MEDEVLTVVPLKITEYTAWLVHIKCPHCGRSAHFNVTTKGREHPCTYCKKYLILEGV